MKFLIKHQLSYLDAIFIGVSALAMHDGCFIAALLIATAGALVHVYFEERAA